MSKTEDRIIAGFARMRALESEIKGLDSELSSIKKELQALIPPGQSRAGIAHEVTPHKAISYSKVVAALRERLIPKTRYSEADKITEEFTSISDRHVLRPEGAE